MTSSRQLAAIMFTDIVGYTALMEEDEQQAFDLLKKNRNIQRPIIEKYHGKWLKEIGDGVLASFSSISGAVFCAKEIQETCREEKDLKLRIGIHQGEVVFEEGDVFGSGVNIASRLESLAPIGGILVSGAVYKNIHNKQGIETTFIEEKKLKGVKNLVKIYQVHVGSKDQVITQLTDSSHKKKQPSTKSKPVVIMAVLALVVFTAVAFWYLNSDNLEKTTAEITDQSIAIIPFKDISPQGDQQWFSDGIMDAVLSDLSNIGGLRVISRTSMEQFRESPKSIPEIANEINVRYILEGSAQRIENKVRIIVQLINAHEDKHIWSENYFRESTEIFEVQNEIARQIALKLRGAMSPSEDKQLDQVPTESLEAYNMYLRGLQYENDFRFRKEKADLRLAIHFYRQSLSLDPNFLLANIHLAKTYLLRSEQLGEGIHLYDSALYLMDNLQRQFPDRSELLSLLGSIYLKKGVNKKQALELLIEAVSLNPNDPESLMELARYYNFEDPRFDLLLILAERVSNIQPNNALPYGAQGWGWLYLHRADEAKDHFKEALQIQPDYSSAIVGLAWIHGFFEKDYNGGISVLKKGLSNNPDDLNLNHHIGQMYSWQGDFDRSEQYFLNVKEAVHQPGYVLTRRTPWFPHRYAYTLWNLDREQEAREYFQEQLDRDILFLKDSIQTFGFFSYYDLAAVNAFLGNKEQAYHWLHELLTKTPSAPFILTDPLFDPIKQDQEFGKFLQRYNHRIARQIRYYTEIKDLPFIELIKLLDQPLPNYVDLK